MLLSCVAREGRIEVTEENNQSYHLSYAETRKKWVEIGFLFAFMIDLWIDHTCWNWLNCCVMKTLVFLFYFVFLIFFIL